MCVVIFVTQTRWYDFFDESLHVMERLRKRQSLLVSPIRGRESCLEWCTASYVTRVTGLGQLD